MSPNITLVVVSGVLVAAGVSLLLERTLTRVLVGITLLSNGVNVLFLVASGPPGGAPIVGRTPIGEMSDPLPQAMVLTAIVITLGMVAFVLALSYRSWQLNGHDEVQDDVEDRRIVRRADRDQASASYDDESRDDGTTAGERTGPGRAGRSAASAGDPDAPPLADALRPDDSEAVGG
ncbi:Na(+)/H(+) antiporter subunit C [Kineococcus terrestris]|uniref:Na(+)/H(+) antiporter subunit C n=1 Tax=Kineococcus terrestris TaxID=2044856 RepID=UPI0034DB57E3